MKYILLYTIIFLGINFNSYSDNNEWRTINKDDLLGKGKATFSYITIDSIDNSIWIGTTKGLVKTNGYDTILYQPPNRFGWYAPTSNIVIDTDNVKWIVTYERIISFKDTNWMKYKPDPGTIGFEYPVDLIIENSNIKWFVDLHSHRLISFDGDKWTISDSIEIKDKGFIHPSFYSMDIDIDGSLWLSGIFIYELTGSDYERALFKYFDNQWSVLTKDYSDWPVCCLGSIFIDKKGNKWFSSDSVVVKYDNVYWEVIKPNNYKIDSLQFIPMADDNEENMWFSFRSYRKNDNDRDMGFAKFDGTDWTYFSKKTGYNLSYPQDVDIDKYGNKWMVVLYPPKVYGDDWIPKIIIYREGGVVNVGLGTPGLDSTTDVVEMSDADTEEIIVYPNPASERLIISGLGFGVGGLGHEKIEIYNVLGESIISLYPQVNQWVDSKGEIEVDVSQLPAGVYYVVVKAGGSVAMRQFAVVR